MIWPERTYEFLLWGVIWSSEAKAYFSTFHYVTIVLKPVNLSAPSIFSTKVVASTKFYRITQWKTKEVCSVTRYCMCGAIRCGKTIGAKTVLALRSLKKQWLVDARINPPQKIYLFHRGGEKMSRNGRRRIERKEKIKTMRKLGTEKKKKKRNNHPKAAVCK